MDEPQAAVPMAATKVLVIDDRVAFCGGATDAGAGAAKEARMAAQLGGPRSGDGKGGEMAGGVEDLAVVTQDALHVITFDS